MIFIMPVYNIQAQERQQHRNMQQNRERIEAQRVAFITDRLDLSSAEAEKFWPVYNEFKDKLKDKQQSWRKQHDFKPENIAEMTDLEAQEFAKAQLNHEQEMLNLRKELLANLNGVISPQKILMLFEAEKDFRVELMRRVSQGRGPGTGKR